MGVPSKELENSPFFGFHVYFKSTENQFNPLSVPRGTATGFNFWRPRNLSIVIARLIPKWAPGTYDSDDKIVTEQTTVTPMLSFLLNVLTHRIFKFMMTVLDTFPNSSVQMRKLRHREVK